MSDLSGLSDDELMTIAGVGGPSDLSGYSDEDLMQIAGAKRPSLGSASRFVGKSLAEGAGDVLGLVADYNPFAGMPALTAQPGGKPSDQINYLREKYIGNAEDEGIVGPVADVAKAALKGSVFPIGGPVANAISGVGAELAAKSFPESRVAPLLGALAGPSVATGAKTTAKMLGGAGRAFERASVGAGVKDYVKSQKLMGRMASEETGETVTRLKQAINEIGDTEGWGAIRTPEALDKKVASKLSEYGGKITDMTAGADKKGISPALQWTNTEKVIKGSTAAKSDLKAGLDEFLEKFTDPTDGWDGTTKGLHKWSSDLRNIAFAGEATGQMPANVARSLKRAIGQDLQASVKDAIKQAGYSKEEIAKIFRGYSNYATVAPVIAEQVTKGEAGTGASILRGLLRTSGGTLTTPTWIGATLGGTVGGPVGFGVGAGLGALGSPTGAGLAGSGLKLGQRAINILKGDATGLASIPAALNAALDSVADVERETKKPETKINNSQNDQKPQDSGNSRKEVDKDSIHTANSTASGLLNPAKSEQSVFMKSPKVLFSKRVSMQKENKSPDLTALVDAVIQQESAGRANAVSEAGARGLMQIMPATWKEWAPRVGVDVDDPFNAEANRKVGSAYLEWLLGQFDGDLELALTAYNQGIGRVKNLLAYSNGSKLADILGQLGPTGRVYAAQVLKRLRPEVLEA